MLQRILTHKNRTDLMIDLAELISGFLLVGFLWAHMFFVATILLGPWVFNQVPKYLEALYLAQIGIPAVILLILAHMVLAGRRIPNRLQEMKMVWKHSRLLMHYDTWTWLFQVITGVAIGILAAAHIWTVVSRWTINIDISAARVTQSPYFIFYIILLICGEYHVGVGLYRIGVKWGWFKRQKLSKVLDIITLCIIALGIISLFWIKSYAGVGGGGE
jgi:fumarate reductase subunit C